jgi:putative spermidine/putrescine transport system substrate-binding protein
MNGKLRLSATASAALLAATLSLPAHADMMTSIGAGEGEVAIVAWAGYIERGETDPAYDWVTGFEQATGCKVTVKTAASSDEMVSLMNAGGFDLVTASGDASLRLISGGTVQEINTALIPSFGTVDPRLQSAPWHTVDGKHYGVPYQWGANVLMYNAKMFPNAPTSWKLVFEEMTLPDGKSNKGRVQAYQGPIYIADAAVYLKMARPELGIEDPYALDQAQFDAAIELLQGQRKLVNRYWGDPAVQVEDFTNEGVVAAPSWPYQVNLMRGEGKVPTGSVVPKEGATGWADTTMMHAQAPHPNCAYMWLEHSLNPALQGGVAAWFGSVPSVPAACTGSPLLGDTGCKTNGMDNFRRIYFWKTPVADCGGGRTCVPYQDWVSSFLAVKGG